MSTNNDERSLFEERLTKLEKSIAKLTQKMTENSTKSSISKEESLNDLKEKTYQRVDQILNDQQEILVMGYFKNNNVTSRFSLGSTVDKIKEINITPSKPIV